jgi:tetratricopeptide (TPR) repeat protein
MPDPPGKKILQTPETAHPPAQLSAVRKELYGLKLQAEAQNLSRWAPDQYHDFLNGLNTAESLFSQQKYQEAAEQYRKSGAEISHLLENREAIFQTLLRDGSQALQEGDPEVALSLIERAQAMYPDSAEAAEISQQIQLRKTVLQRYREAEELESGQKYQAAAKTLAEILTLDPGYGPAVEASARVARILTVQAVQNELNLFYRNMEEGNFDGGREALVRLQRLDPANPLVIRAEEYFGEQRESFTIQGLRVKAEHYSGTEQWRSALQTYREILAINPETMFAAAGSETAAKRYELDTALEKALEQPQRLQDPGVRKEVSQLLAYAAQYQPGGNRLTGQVDRLQSMLSKASTQIRITLESDNQTEITIYHIGRLGRFISKEIDLVPGTYTIVGSRTGYRDVRKTVTITGDSDNRFRIACNEPI